MFFPIKCQGKDHSGIRKTKTEGITVHLYCQLIDLVRSYKDGCLHECPTASLVLLWASDTHHI